MTLKLIETLKTSVYSPKHPRTLKYFSFFSKFSEISKSIFFKEFKFKNQRFVLICIALFILLRATQPN